VPEDRAERLWLTEPRRKTCLAEVVEVRGDAFRLDRTLFRPRSRAYRHPQRHDQGTVWIDGGDKRELVTASDRGGEVWHRLDGEPPAEGAELQCHLDRERRGLDSRAHTGMHLLLAAAHDHEAPPLAADPEVKGGGRFRLEFRSWHLDADALAAWLRRANQYVAQDVPVERVHVPRDAAEHRLDPQRLEEGGPFPGPEGSLEAVQIEGICSYPCDGTHAERTGDVDELVVRDTHRHDDGRVVVVGEVPKPGRYD